MSRPGAGSTFTLALPPRLPEATAPDVDAPAWTATTAPISADVLVVEDNDVNRFLARMLLEKLGLTVHEAVDGREAVERAAGTAFAAVFMDCQMPELDGFAATRELRAGGVTVPVIALTADAMPGDRDRYTRAPVRHAGPAPGSREASTPGSGSTRSTQDKVGDKAGTGAT